MPRKLNLREFLQRHIRLPSITRDRHVKCTVSEIMELMELSIELFKIEPSALAVASPPIVVVGDIHGQYFDLIRIFAMLRDRERNVQGWKRFRFMFLGDYVDRGRRSVECVCLLLTLKLLYPKKYNLLRGNHETKGLNRVYGFYDEIRDRFDKDDAEMLWKKFNEVFSYLPFAGLIGKKILCMHGGISPHLNSIDDILHIPMPLDEPLASDLAQDLIWSDPMTNNSGFVKNAVRGTSVYFAENEVYKLCQKTGIELIIRAHQVMAEGHGFFANRKLITLFSAPRYQPELANKGAIILIDKNGRISFKIMCPEDVQSRPSKGSQSNSIDNTPSESDRNFEKKKSDPSEKKSADEQTKSLHDKTKSLMEKPKGDHQHGAEGEKDKDTADAKQEAATADKDTKESKEVKESFYIKPK